MKIASTHTYILRRYWEKKNFVLLNISISYLYSGIVDEKKNTLIK